MSARDTTVGVILGAAAIVLAAWYLNKTQGGLLPGVAGLFSGSAYLGNGSWGSQGSASPSASGGGCGCGGGCGAAIPNGQNYQATSLRGPGNPPVTGIL